MNTNYPPRTWLDTLGVDTRVMIIDTGLRPDVSCLHIDESKLFVGTDLYDPSGHGTSVALTIGSRDDYSTGMAPQAHLLIAQAIDPHVKSWTPILQALDWALDVRPDVVNMSFAHADRCDEMTKKLTQLDELGVICCAAFSPKLRWPHQETCVVAVAALDGPPIVKARTVGVWSTSPVAGRSGPFKGTSAACAVMAGVAACAKSFNRRLNRQKFLKALEG